MRNFKDKHVQDKQLDNNKRRLSYLTSKTFKFVTILADNGDKGDNNEKTNYLKNVDGNIPGGNFLGGNFPGMGGLYRGSFIGGNFPGGIHQRGT